MAQGYSRVTVNATSVGSSPSFYVKVSLLNGAQAHRSIPSIIGQLILYKVGTPLNTLVSIRKLRCMVKNWLSNR